MTKSECELFLCGRGGLMSPVGQVSDKEKTQNQLEEKTASQLINRAARGANPAHP